jgi:hypothetical protein
MGAWLKLYPFMISAAREVKRLARPSGRPPRPPRAPNTTAGVVESPSLVGSVAGAAARKEPPPAETRGESEVDLTVGDWATSWKNRWTGSSTNSGAPAFGKEPRQWEAANYPR